MTKITFDQLDLLTPLELSNLSSKKLKDELSEILSKKLCKYIVISNGSVYLFNKQYIFYLNKGLYENYAEEFKNHIIRFINESIRKLENDNKLIYDSCIAKLSNLQDTLTQKNILNLVKSDLTNDIIFFNDNSHDKKIHFLNGYFDFKKNKFIERTYNKDFITYCIPRVYDETLVKEEHKEIIRKAIKKILPNEHDRNKIFEFLGRALIGEITKEQISLFLLGVGSNGKSFIMSLLKLCLCEYVIELRGDVFRTDNPKQDKILNTLNNKEHACFIWINELDEKKMNEILFKEFVEGKIKTTILFRDGLNEILYKALAIITSNNFPNIKIDGGIKRRIKAYTFGSKFVEEEEKHLVNEEKNIYLKDHNLYQLIENDDILKNAFFSYIKDYSIDYLKGIKYNYTQNFNDTYESIINVNDKTGNFFKSFLIKTTEDKDRLSANEIKDKFNEVYKQHLSDKNILNDMKNNGYTFDYKKRHKGSQGCFVCVKFNTKALDELVDISNDEEDQNPLDHGIEYKFGKSSNINPLDDGVAEPDYKALYNTNQKEKDEIIDRQNKEIEELKAKLKQLEEQLKPKEEPKKETIKEQLNFDNIEDMINKSTKKASKAKKNKSTKVKEEPKEEDVETDDEDIKNFKELAKDYF
jgi:hypothetical protein